MHERIHSDLEAVLASRSLAALSDGFEQAVAGLGGSGYAIGSFPSRGVFVPGIDRGLNGWLELCDAEDYIPACPTANAIVSAEAPFTWDEVRRSSTDDPVGTAILDAAADLGLSHGIFVPLLTRAGARGFTFVKLPDEELPTERRIPLLTLAVAAHTQFDQLGSPAPLPDEPLREREREVLTWMARGKSAADVAEILGLSAATVMFHYRNVANRYGTLNRTHTVVEAIRRRAISLD